MASAKKIAELREYPDAWAPFAEKLNEAIREINAQSPIAGVGMAITRTDNGTRYDISGLSATGVCEGDDTITITIQGQ
jgi:hypothetical protein